MYFPKLALKRKNIFIFLLFPILLTSSCMMLHPLKVGKIESFKIKKADLESATIEIGIPIENPNFFKVAIKTINFEILINNNKIGNASLLKILNIGAKSDKVQKISVQLKYENILGGILALSGSEDMKVRCSGTADTKSLFFSKKVKVDIENNINLQQAFD